jgi:hypothetical protein
MSFEATALELEAARRREVVEAARRSVARAPAWVAQLTSERADSRDDGRQAERPCAHPAGAVRSGF